MANINERVKLPCGLVLKNRLIKAAMTEGLADSSNLPSQGLCNLYHSWSAQSGCGALLTGNFMVDRRFLERPGNVVIPENEEENEIKKFKDFAQSVVLEQGEGSKLIAQVGHAGPQSTGTIVHSALGPSPGENGPNAAKGYLPAAQTIIEMTENDISEVIEKFGKGAAYVKKAGFSGIQIHSAHGYLLSSFFNPRKNARTDKYGGDLENRARFLLEVVRSVKKAVNYDSDQGFAVCVKLNSSDFQQGGFTVDECVEVAIMLQDEGIDILELSGGNYEEPALLQGAKSGKAKTTIAREAYFLGFADQIIRSLGKHCEEKSISEDRKIRLMVTGGFRSAAAMNHAISVNHVDIIGIGRPLTVNHFCTQDLLNGKIKVLPSTESSWTLPWYLGWNALKSLDYCITFGQVDKLVRALALLTNYSLFVEMGDEKLFTTDLTKQKPNLLTELNNFVKQRDAVIKNMDRYPADDKYVLDQLKQ